MRKRVFVKLFGRVHATLHVGVSVRPSVVLSFGNGIELLQKFNLKLDPPSLSTTWLHGMACSFLDICIMAKMNEMLACLLA